MASNLYVHILNIRKKSKKKKAKKSRKESSSSSSDQSAEEDDDLGELWVEKTRLDDHVVGPEAPLTHLNQDNKPLEWVVHLHFIAANAFKTLLLNIIMSI